MRDTRECLLELERLATDGSREKRDELLERVTEPVFPHVRAAKPG